MLKALRPNPSRVPTAKGTSIPAPVGGWDAVSALADMPEDRAVVLENWFPSTGDVRVRRGSKIHASGMGSGVVESLMPYNGLTSAASKLFAATANKIYDATSNAAATSALAARQFYYVGWQISLDLQRRGRPSALQRQRMGNAHSYWRHRGQHYQRQRSQEPSVVHL